MYYCKNCGNEIQGKSKKFCCIECKNQFYYKQNKDPILAKNRKWSSINKEKRARIKRERYANDENYREKLLQQNRKYYKNKDLNGVKK